MHERSPVCNYPKILYYINNSEQLEYVFYRVNVVSQNILQFENVSNFCMRSFCLIFLVYFVQILAEAKELSRVHTLAASDSKIDPLLQSK